MNDLSELRAASREAWRLDIYTPHRLERINAADSVYLPALEAEVDRLRAVVGETLLGSTDD